MLLKKPEDNMSTKLKSNYLLGIDASSRKSILTFSNKQTDEITYEERKLTEDVLKLLNNCRRRDCSEFIDKIFKIINQLELIETEEKKTSSLEFRRNGNRFILNYYVSKDFLRDKEEIEFLNLLVKKYCKNRLVYDINNKIVDFAAFKDNKQTMSYESLIALIDDDNYLREVHISGKNICPALMNYINGVKETQEFMKPNRGRKI